MRGHRRGMIGYETWVVPPIVALWSHGALSSQGCAYLLAKTHIRSRPVGESSLDNPSLLLFEWIQIQQLRSYTEFLIRLDSFSANASGCWKSAPRLVQREMAYFSQAQRSEQFIRSSRSRMMILSLRLQGSKYQVGGEAIQYHLKWIAYPAPYLSLLGWISDRSYQAFAAWHWPLGA